MGLATAVALALRGLRVCGVDLDPDLIQRLRQGECPLRDEGVGRGLREALQGGSLRFTTDAGEALADAGVVFICVGTPSAAGGAADLTAVEAVVDAIARGGKKGALAVIKSTVPAGTADRLRPQLLRRGIGLASNPEFLREGSALDDMLAPDRVVVGTAREEDRQRLDDLYRRMSPSCRILHTSCASAELVKYGSNVLLAAKVAFAGELARLAGQIPGADIDEIVLGMETDPRIGKGHLQARTGFGGPCFPKDVAALVEMLGDRASFPLTTSLIASNERHRDGLVARLESLLKGRGRELAGATIAVWGLVFKAGVADLRNASSLHVISRLEQAGAAVRAWDPLASDPGFARHWDRQRGSAGEGPELGADAVQACEGADALMILTEDPAFAKIPPSSVAGHLRLGLVYDCCRSTVPEAWKAAGVDYVALGRGGEGDPSGS